MELLMELLLEVYGELMMRVVPDEYAALPTFRRWVIAVAVTVLLLVFGLAIWGLWLLLDEKNTMGWIPLGGAIVLSLVQIIAGIFLHDRK